MQQVVVSAGQAGQRLDKYLHRLLPNAGMGFLYRMMRKKNITLNGGRAHGEKTISQGDIVRFFFSDETYAKFAGNGAGGGREADKIPGKEHMGMESRIREYTRAYRRLADIGVVYEDGHVLILNKPAGILTQKASAGDLSLNEWLIGYLIDKDPALVSELKGFHPSVCNRLDRNTSGLVLCGKTVAGLRFLSGCIRERGVRKFYRAICAGDVKEPALVRGYLKKDTARNQARVTLEQREGGEYIETSYRPVCRGKGCTLLEVELITGKPHQIRAHLAGLGHPLIGDLKYGDTSLNRQFSREYGLRHQLLHAIRAEFPETEDPAGAALSGKTVSAPCPEPFLRIQEALGLSGPLA